MVPWPSTGYNFKTKPFPVETKKNYVIIGSSLTGYSRGMCAWLTLYSFAHYYEFELLIAERSTADHGAIFFAPLTTSCGFERFKSEI